MNKYSKTKYEFKTGDKVRIITVYSGGHWKVGDTATWRGGMNVIPDRQISTCHIKNNKYEFQLISGSQYQRLISIGFKE
jgi:hypothetical protein